MTNKELDKLKTLALDYRANAVFTSWDCYDKDPKKWAENLNIIFLPIGFGGIKFSIHIIILSNGIDSNI